LWCSFNIGTGLSTFVSSASNISKGLLAPALQYSATAHPVGTLIASTNCPTKQHTIPKRRYRVAIHRGSLSENSSRGGVNWSLPILGPCSCTRIGRECSACKSAPWSCFAFPPGMFRVSDKAGPFYYPQEIVGRKVVESQQGIHVSILEYSTPDGRPS
jgi:hypothetical protein